jgi:two-component system, response regulator PdtaR
MKNGSKLSILIVDDEALIAEDIKEICIENGYDVQSVCYTALQALSAISKNEYDLVLLDINLEDELNGIEIAQFINRNCKHTHILFITSYSDKNILNEAKNVHPIGYIVKPFNKAQLISTIEIAIYNVLKHRLPNSINKKQLEENYKIELTDREIEILNLICEGKTNQQIADDIYLSVNTIKFHIKNIYDKLEVRNRTELLLKLKI